LSTKKDRIEEQIYSRANEGIENRGKNMKGDGASDNEIALSHLRT